MPKQRKAIRLDVVVYADADPELFAWLAGLDEGCRAYGEKARRVRELLVAGLRSNGTPSPGTPTMPPLNLEGLTATLLAQVRPVVEAAVISALQGLHLTGGAPPVAEDAATATFVDMLLDSVMLE